MTALKLLPCPFCGGEAKLIEGDECAYVQCLQVKNHRGPFVDGDNAAADEASAAWNARTDLAQAAVAAAYEAAAKKLHWLWNADGTVTERRVSETSQAAIRALATADQAAALAASPDTIPLPRAEVEDVADTLNLVADWMEKSVKDRRIIGPEFHVPTLRKALATLQERMK